MTDELNHTQGSLSGQLRAVSYGGGVQSTALLVLAAQGRIDFPVFLFANVGDDSEHPDTLAYVHDIAVPYAAEHGIELHELRYQTRDGRNETLYEKLVDPDRPGVYAPFKFHSTGAPATRSCTQDYKIRTVGRWLREHGATKTDPAVVGLGISVDEIQRAAAKNTEVRRVLTYPLLDLGMRRTDCMALIEQSGLPVPPKSACWFCPFRKLHQWGDMRRDDPALFGRAVELENTVNETRAAHDREPVWLTDKRKPLPMALGEGTQQSFPIEGECDSGFCWT